VTFGREHCSSRLRSLFIFVTSLLQVSEVGSGRRPPPGHGAASPLHSSVFLPSLLLPHHPRRRPFPAPAPLHGCASTPNPGQQPWLQRLLATSAPLLGTAGPEPPWPRHLGLLAPVRLLPRMAAQTPWPALSLQTPMAVRPCPDQAVAHPPAYRVPPPPVRRSPRPWQLALIRASPLTTPLLSLAHAPATTPGTFMVWCSSLHTRCLTKCLNRRQQYSSHAWECRRYRVPLHPGPAGHLLRHL